MRHKTALCAVCAVTLTLFAGCKNNTPANNAAATQDASGQPAATGSNGAAGNNGGAAMNQAAAPAPAPAPAPEPITVPAGTTVSVTLSSGVSSKTSQDGEEFHGSLAEAIVVGDTVVIPRGANVAGVVREAHSAGKFKGAASLKLALVSIDIHGRPTQIDSSLYSQVTKGKGKRTAGVIGGGAAAGALIGGLAGGGKGAGIGALIGGGAGTAGAAYTGNDRDINLPAETTIRFKLEQPLTVTM